uniref:Uncharacterized protein n=1 Tax=Fervidobacterium pennivorans TaxID=93466 RepID=A0A7V4KE24_FERPE
MRQTAKQKIQKTDYLKKYVYPDIKVNDSEEENSKERRIVEKFICSHEGVKIIDGCLHINHTFNGSEEETDPGLFVISSMYLKYVWLYDITPIFFFNTRYGDIVEQEMVWLPLLQDSPFSVLDTIAVFDRVREYAKMIANSENLIYWEDTSDEDIKKLGINEPDLITTFGINIDDSKLHDDKFLGLLKYEFEVFSGVVGICCINCGEVETFGAKFMVPCYETKKFLQNIACYIRRVEQLKKKGIKDIPPYKKLMENV